LQEVLKEKIQKRLQHYTIFSSTAKAVSLPTNRRINLVSQLWYRCAITARQMPFIVATLWDQEMPTSHVHVHLQNYLTQKLYAF